jgi:hypothetical protein
MNGTSPRRSSRGAHDAARESFKIIRTVRRGRDVVFRLVEVAVPRVLLAKFLRWADRLDAATTTARGMSTAHHDPPQPGRRGASII